MISFEEYKEVRAAFLASMNPALNRYVNVNFEILFGDSGIVTQKNFASPEELITQLQQPVAKQFLAMYGAVVWAWTQLSDEDKMQAKLSGLQPRGL